MKFGFTSTSFRQIRDLEKIVRTARTAGADCIEWGGDVHVRNLEDAKNAKKYSDAYGIEISSYGTYYRVGSKDKENWKYLCETAALMDCKSVRVWLGRKDSEKTSESEYLALVEDAKSMCEAAKNYGMIVCPECHDHTFNNNTDAFLKIREDVGEDNFRTYFQSRYKKQEYDLDRIDRTLPFIENIHISFSERVREQFPCSDPAYIDRLIGKLNECGFDGTYLLEYTYIFSRAGIPSSMIRDIAKLKEKVGTLK